MRKKLLVTSLFLGVFFDILFWKKVPGISFAVFILICLISGYLMLRSENQQPATRNAFLLIPILFFSVMSFFRLDPLTTFLNYVITLFSTAVLALTYQNGLWLSYSVGDYVVNLFRLGFSMLSFILFRKKDKDLQQNTSSGIIRKNSLLPIIRGLLLSIPIIIIFSTLFSSADLIFSQRLNKIISIFKLDNLPELIFRGVYILLVANFIAGIIMYAASKSISKKLIGMEKPIVEPFLGFTEASIILGSVMALFCIFVIIQFKYFFFGQTNISQLGFTYSEYARRGFGELVVVAFFSLVLLQSLSVVTKRENKWQAKGFSGLVIGEVILVIVILVSSFQRLSLYEAAYGFSRLRAYSHVFMIWLGLLLTAVVLLEIFKKPRAFTNYVILMAIGFSVSINLVNIDAFIARQNIRRAINGKELDAAYIATLSVDAVPTLVREFTLTNNYPKIQDEIGAALVCYQLMNESNPPEPQHWQSFHMSKWRANQDLEKIQMDLDGYSILDHIWPKIIISPEGLEIPCREALFFD